MKSQRRAVTAVPWAFAETISDAVNGLASTLVVGYFLTPQDVGEAGIAMSVIVLLEIVCAFGIGEAIVRTRSIHTSVTDSAYSGLLAMSVVGAAACCALSWPAAALFHDPEIARLLLVGGILLPLSALGVVPVAILTRKMRVSTLVKRGILARTTTLFVAAGLAYDGWGPWSIMISSIVGSALAGLTLVGSISRWPRLRLDRRELRELMSFGGLISLEMLLVTATTRLFSLAFGAFHGVAALGYLQFAQRLIDEMANLIQNLALRFGLSFFANMEREGGDTAAAFFIGTEVAMLIAAPTLVGFALVYPDALAVVGELRWLPSRVFILVAAISWTTMFPTILISPLMRARGMQRPLITYSALSCAATLVGCVATAHAGVVLAAIAWGARHYFAVPAGIWIIGRFLGIPWQRYLLTFVKPATGTAVMAIAVLAVGEWGLSTPQRFAVEVALGAVVYVAVMLLLEYRTLRRLVAARLANRTPA